MLTERQRAAYAQQGFLVLPDFFTVADAARLRERAMRIVDEWQPSAQRSVFTTNEQTRTANREFLDSGSGVWCFFEEDAFGPDGALTQPKALSINKIGHAQHDLDDEFRRFSYDPRIGAVLRDLGVVEPRALQSMYIFKQPRIGGEVTCHQDATFLYTDPITVTGCWFAIEDATIDNGCLWAAPGAHRGPLRQLFKRDDPDDPDAAGGAVFELVDATALPTPPVDVRDPGDSPFVPLEVDAGTMIVLHGLLPHWSGPNRSPTSRHAYSLHAISARADYPRWNWLQRPADMPLSPL